MAVSYDIPLHDIKPLMEVPDSSFTLFTVVLMIAVVLLLGVLYLLYRFIQSSKTVNYRKVHFQALKNIDFKDSKRAAYAITEYGRIFAEDSERINETYLNLVSRLEVYKYQKTVAKIDDESRSYYKIYLGMIDV